MTSAAPSYHPPPVVESPRALAAVASPPARRITLRDEGELTWFFCRGEAQFQRSVHGAMVDRLERDSMGANRCWVCHGSGIIEEARAQEIHARRSKSVAWREYREQQGPRLGSALKSRVNWSVTRTVERAVLHPGDPIWTTETVTTIEGAPLGLECDFCRGTGWIPAKRMKPRCQDVYEPGPGGTMVLVQTGCWGRRPAARARCRQCLGTGVPQVDARPVCAPVESRGVEVDGDTLRRFAAVSRRLARCPEASREVLRTHYGPEGRTWADEPRGAILGLEAHTDAGAALVRRTRVDGDDALETSVAERIAAQDALQRSAPKAWRGEALDAAARQAGAMLEVAHLDWLASAPSRLGSGLRDLEDAIDETGRAWEAWLDRHWTAGVDVDEGGAP